tara:strand:- start:278 stop:415 length:138 start_codon:yes stop_codon:yes gene_type:complete
VIAVKILFVLVNNVIVKFTSAEIAAAYIAQAVSQILLKKGVNVQK